MEYLVLPGHSLGTTAKQDSGTEKMFILFISEMVTTYRLALMATVEKENH